MGRVEHTVTTGYFRCSAQNSHKREPSSHYGHYEPLNYIGKIIIAF